ncbi:MAG: hypothetical protein AAF446_06320 [Pseudomonadota bacterium]
MQQKLGVVKIWKDFAWELNQKFWVIVQAILLPSIAMAVVEFLLVKSDVSFAVRVLCVLPYLFLLSLTAISCHRIVLAGSDSLKSTWGIYWDQGAWNYLVALVGFIVCMLLVTVVLVVLSMAFFLLFSAVGGIFDLFQMVMMLLLGGCFLYIISRLSILLPARAVGDPASFEQLIELSQGNGWRLTIATAMPAILLGLLLSPISNWIMESGSPWIFFPSLLMGLVTTIITICLLSCAYRRLLNLKLEAEDLLTSA